MSRASLAAFRRTTEILWPQKQEQGAKKHLLSVARAGNEEIMRVQTAREGIAPSVEAYANTPGNANLESVVLPGPIVYKYDYRAEIIYVALQELRAASPQVSGAYRNSHTAYVNGMPMQGISEGLPPSAEVFISNPLPYARRLEIGLTKSGRSFVMQVPDRIYERTADRLSRRYGKTAAIRFNYVQLPGAWRIKGRLSAHYQTMERPRPYLKPRLVQRKRYQRAGDLVRAPAIIIEPLA